MEKKNKMKKIFKNLFIFSLMCIFSSCEFFTDSFNAPVKDFFRDNTEAAEVMSYVFSVNMYNNPVSNNQTISSAQDVDIKFLLRNPQEYEFVKDENLFVITDRMVFDDCLIQQDGKDKSILTLKLSKELLRNIEINSRDDDYKKTSNFTIDLRHPVSGLKFKLFSFKFDCDTIPPSVFSPVYYITTSSYPNSSMQNKYVIAFNMPKKSEINSEKIHNDLSKLVINKKEYSISIADDGTIKFPNNSGIIAGDVNTIEGIEPINIKFVTQDDYQPFYIVTNEPLCSEGAKATLSLVDKGNFSSIINVSSNTRTLGKVLLKANNKVFTSENEVIKINQEENESYANITIIPPSVSVDLNGAEEPVSDVFVKYTLTNTDTNKVVTGSNNGSGSVTIDVPIGTYKLECISHLDYYADSVTTFESIQINGSLFNFYVAESGDDSYSGTLSAPVKTIQKAVDKVIAMNKVTASSEGNPYKILLLSDIETSSTDSFENNALVNIDPSSASASGNPLYLTISKYGGGNATINAKNTGRVMYIGEKANVTLENLILTGGYLLGANGGGIYSKGICNLNYCTISGNTAKASGGSVRGGGVYIESGSFTMEDCIISGNTAGSETDNANAYGGGVYINNSSTFTMTSGEIFENSAKFGGGVSVSGGTFIMEGGSISTNTVTENGKGKGVHVVKSNNIDSLFEISGDASITENDVYLTADQKITITGNLSTTGKVAKITPQSYAEKVVLVAGKDFALDEELVEKFSVTKYSDNVETIITAITEEKGCLKNTLNDAEELNANLYDICSTINVRTADGMKAISDLSQKNGEVEGKDFAGKTINLKAPVVLDDEYKPIHTFSGVFDGKDHTITLTKPSEYGYYTNFYLGGAIFYVIKGETAEKAEVRNLDVYGEAYIAGIAMELKNDAVISNCNNYADITSPNGTNVHGCGGIVGELSDGGVIKNCKNEGTITYNSTNDNGCGGIVGAISGTHIGKRNSIIANCINNKEIKRIQVQIENMDDQKASIGGICGKVEGKAAIYNCVNTQYGSVTSLTDQNVTENIGGITGYCSLSFYDEEFPSLPADMGIFNCYNSGKISCENNSDSKCFGGIVGQGYVYTTTQLSVIRTIRVTNTVNNDEKTYAFGNITRADSSTYFDITNNFYKFNGSSPLDPYESTFYNNPNTFVTKLNEYSTKSNGKYLQWCVGGSGSTNIIFSEEIIGN